MDKVYEKCIFAQSLKEGYAGSVHPFWEAFFFCIFAYINSCVKGKAPGQEGEIVGICLKRGDYSQDHQVIALVNLNGDVYPEIPYAQVPVSYVVCEHKKQST